MEAIAATAVHEAAHVVIGHIFGEKHIAAAILDDSHAEVIPECSFCETCWEFYHGRDPKKYSHSREIQDVYRRDAAVAIAGELAECRFTHTSDVADPTEVAVDREKVRCRASAIHIFADADCFCQGKWARDEPCALCETFITALRQSVSAILEEQQIWEAVLAFASELRSKRRMEGEEIRGFLAGLKLSLGTRPLSELPTAP